MKEGKDGRGGDTVGERDEGNIQGSFAIISVYRGGDYRSGTLCCSVGYLGENQLLTLAQDQIILSG